MTICLAQPRANAGLKSYALLRCAGHIGRVPTNAAGSDAPPRIPRAQGKRVSGICVSRACALLLVLSQWPAAANTPAARSRATPNSGRARSHAAPMMTSESARERQRFMQKSMHPTASPRAPPTQGTASGMSAMGPVISCRPTSMARKPTSRSPQSAPLLALRCWLIISSFVREPSLSQATSDMVPLIPVRQGAKLFPDPAAGPRVFGCCREITDRVLRPGQMSAREKAVRTSPTASPSPAAKRTVPGAPSTGSSRRPGMGDAAAALMEGGLGERICSVSSPGRWYMVASLGGRPPIPTV
mmetsp:Transcript_112726/g.319306  ORF Transcript_112726/g.319306 Transcript_112726/m.319306 type:complete len:300 (-) Transcript_112726:711-1610(-)